MKTARETINRGKFLVFYLYVCDRLVQIRSLTTIVLFVEVLGFLIFFCNVDVRFYHFAVLEKMMDEVNVTFTV